MTRKDVRRDVQINLDDINAGQYSIDAINDSIQDCYDDIACKTLFLVKSTTVNLIGSCYYDFKALGILDYLGTIAVLNNNTNMFLQDNVSLKDLDYIRWDWELWRGQPIFWCPHSLDKIVIGPQMESPIGSFKLFYFAQAPRLSDDVTNIIIADDVQTAFEHYCTADQLEIASEYKKAVGFWVQYNNSVTEYKRRTQVISVSDYVARV